MDSHHIWLLSWSMRGGSHRAPFGHSRTLVGLGHLSTWKSCHLFPLTDAAAPPASDKPTKPHRPFLGIWELSVCPSLLPGPQAGAGFWLGVREGKGLMDWHTGCDCSNGVTHSLPGPYTFCIAYLCLKHIKVNLRELL